MWRGRTLVRVPLIAGAALFSIHCTDAASPERQAPGPLAATTAAPGSGITLDQSNGAFGTPGNPMTVVIGFNPKSPHVGDAIVATFAWFGAPGGVTGNIIDRVTDVLTTNPPTPVGNHYELVEFVTNGAVSMATYVATNVQGFTGEGTDPVLAVEADFSVPITDVGVLLSAWTGVAAVSTQALGQHSSGSGNGTPSQLTGPTTADPGPISVNAGALAYGFSLASPPVGVVGPSGWTSIPPGTQSDMVMAGDGRYDAQFTVSSNGGSVEPQWSWSFSAPGSWLATVLALNAAPTTGDLRVTTTTSGENQPASGYTVTVDGTTSQTIATSGEVTFTSLQPGNHDVLLSGLPSNCEVTSANPVTVTIVAGETATVTFTVRCSAPPPPPA